MKRHGVERSIIRSSWRAVGFYRPAKKLPKNVVVKIEWRR